jgi:hypothetical protein
MSVDALVSQQKILRVVVFCQVILGRDDRMNAAVTQPTDHYGIAVHLLLREPLHEFLGRVNRPGDQVVLRNRSIPVAKLTSIFDVGRLFH